MMTASIQTQIRPAPNPVLLATHSNLLQRKCACGGTPGPSGECEACRKKREGKLQYFPSPTEREAKGEVPSIVHDVLRSPGQPLDPPTRAFLESRFGFDFSQVRVHTDAKAAESARIVNALAYTVGRDVVFGADQYAPTTRVGQRLLAHELTHTIQQQMHETSRLMIVGSLEHEREANIAADTIHAHKAIPTPKPLYLRSY